MSAGLPGRNELVKRDGQAQQMVVTSGPQPDRLPRQLGVWSAAAVCVGSMIGSGIFRVPSAAAAATGTDTAMMLTWLVGGLVAVTGALSLAEVAALFPRAGGLYVYLREAYGPLTSFLFGWLILIISPASTAAVALAFGEYVGRLVPALAGNERVMAVLSIVVFAAANYRSVRYGAAIQNVLTSAKVLGIASLTLAAFTFSAAAPPSTVSDPPLPPAT